MAGAARTPGGMGHSALSTAGGNSEGRLASRTKVRNSWTSGGRRRPIWGVSGGPGGTEVARVKLRELGRRSLGAEGNKLLQKKTGPVAAEFIGIGKIIESAEGPHNRRPRSMLVASITSFVQAGQQRHTMQK